MTQQPPDTQLMAATIDYLETQLLPSLASEHRFKTRLAVNALKILHRSQLVAQNGPDDLLETDDSNGEGVDTHPSLAEQIRQRQIALEDPALLLVLEQQLKKSLQINNPKWLVD